MITPAQCLQARKLLHWTPERLASRCESSSTTIRLFEKGERPISPEGLAIIQSALEEGGVEFTNGGQPSVRMKSKGHLK
jgi:transcriptional regulator with XRE-family HTH domain